MITHLVVNESNNLEFHCILCRTKSSLLDEMVEYLKLNPIALTPKGMQDLPGPLPPFKNRECTLLKDASYWDHSNLIQWVKANGKDRYYGILDVWSSNNCGLSFIEFIKQMGILSEISMIPDSIRDLSFEELFAQSQPIYSNGLWERMAELTKGVKVDFDEELLQENEENES